MSPRTDKPRDIRKLPAGCVENRSDAAAPLEPIPLEKRIARIVSKRFGMPVIRVEQEAHFDLGTHPSGVATCALESGESRSVFWKVGPARRVEWAGLRFASVGYEICAYASIRKVAEAPAPVLIGSEIRKTDALLVTEYAGSMCRIHKMTPETEIERAMERAAYRIGMFHKHTSPARPDGTLDRYNAKMFGFWGSQVARRFPEVPWLGRVLDVFPSLADALQGTSNPIIHGEYYPRNILASADGIMAVDWEWAGIGMGEIDLAALTENWDASTVAACMSSYAASRRIRITDKFFRKRFAASRLYLHVRMLGMKRLSPEKTRWRLENVHSLAGELGIL